MKRILTIILTALLTLPPLQASELLDDCLQFVPSATSLSLGLVGVKGKLGFRDRLIVSATSAVAVTALTYGTKLCVSEERPDGTDHHSFPSGHAARAFMGAELMRINYGLWIGAGGYAVAVGVGYLRIHHHRHHFHDVAAGAAIGILSAHIGHWLLPFNKRWLGLDRDVAVAALPSFDPTTRTLSLHASILF